MRIGIDISQIVYGTGVSIYTQEIVRNLLQIDRENNYLLFGGSLRRKADLERFSHSLIGKHEEKFVSYSPTILDFVWNRFHMLNIEKMTGSLDVYHSSDWTQAPSNAFKVTTVHDLAPIKFSNETPKRIVDVHKRRLYWVLKEMDRIITPTNFIRDELVQFGADPNKIRVIYEAAGENFKKNSQAEIDEVKRRYAIRENYVLAIGTGKRKNTTKIIEAYEKSKKNFKLVIVGGGKMDLDARGIINTGFVSDNDLISLYSGASALIYPSLYEGFGLPILQAMACECPVVTSDLGSMKEVALKAAVLVDPNDTNSIAAGIDKAVANPKSLGRAGLKRAKDFSWKKAAKETLEVYKESLVK
jgi:glycosyltransferase involved in cell wall biosynthesis